MSQSKLQDPEGAFEYALSDDGLTLNCRWTRTHPSRLSLTTTYGWESLDLAEAHYDAAKRNFERMIANQAAITPGEARRASAFRVPGGMLCVQINTGPPTWWLPNFGVKFTRQECYIRGGWLRLAVVLAWWPSSRRTA